MRPRLAEGYGRLPLAFERNDGQTAAQVKYLARGRGYALFLAADEAVLALRKPSVISSQLSVVSRQLPRATDNGPRTTDIFPNSEFKIHNSRFVEGRYTLVAKN